MLSSLPVHLSGLKGVVAPGQFPRLVLLSSLALD